jgi:hypothetical protein
VEFQPRKGRRLRLVVRDGAKGQVSGADYAATKVTWGDRRSADGKEGAFAITHRYARAGRFRVAVDVRDTAGNTATIRRWVVAR